MDKRGEGRSAWDSPREARELKERERKWEGVERREEGEERGCVERGRGGRESEIES